MPFTVCLVLTSIVRWENKITEHNFGSLLRTDAQGEYSETNTIFGTRHSTLDYATFLDALFGI